MPQIRTVRLVNPHKKKRKKVSSRNRRPRKRNTLGGGELLIMTNPKKKRNRRPRSRNARRRSRKSNPFVSTRSRRHSVRRRRSNPSIAGFAGSELVKLGLGAAGGAIGTRYLTQVVLGDKNTGGMGYAANIASAIALAYGAAKFAGSDIAKGVAAGGLASVILRIWNEKVSGTSPAALSGYMGDLDFSSDGLGAYISSGFPLPTVSGQNGNYLSVPAGYSWGPAGAPVGAGVAPGASTAPNVNVQSGIPAGTARFAARF